MIIVIWLSIILISTMVGSGKQRPLMGFFLGVFLGIIGLAIIACMSSKIVCRHCGSGMREGYTRCSGCGHDSR